MNDDLIQRLDNLWAMLEGEGFYTKANIVILGIRRIEELKAENEKLCKALELYERERERFRHAKPEITGEYFLAGGHGDIDSNMLPQFVRICPAYGAGWEQIYEKIDKTINYEGS